MNKLILLLGIAILLVGSFFAFNTYIYTKKQGPTDYKDATYILEGQPVTLTDGISEDGSVRYFGNDAKGDIDGDGINDLAFLITKDGGGSGTFYYLVAALQTPNNTYNGTHAVFIGDRIAPQVTEYHGFSGIPGGYIIVNYADRLPEEPMTERPSVGKSLWLKLDPGTMQFGEIVQDFEGEADPSTMTLGMKTWEWIRAEYDDGRVLLPKQRGVFTLTFSAEDRFSVTTDCNTMSGTYETRQSAISFGGIASTKMYCEDSQESAFAPLLTDVVSYHFTSRGELILDLKLDSGSVTFR